MTKLFTLGLLAALGVTLATSDAQAFGRRNKGCSSGPAYSTSSSGCGGCGSSSYGGGYGYPAQYGGYRADAGMTGGMYYAQGQNMMMAGPTGTSMMAMPMPAAGTTASPAGTSTASKPATITVKVPTAEAQVWFEKAMLPQTGKERTFNTHPLADGKSEDFTVKAKWMTDDGKVMEKTLTVSAKAGQASTVEFR